MADRKPVEHDDGVDDVLTVNLDELARELLTDAAMQSALRAAHTLPHPVTACVRR